MDRREFLSLAGLPLLAGLGLGAAHRPRVGRGARRTCIIIDERMTFKSTPEDHPNPFFNREGVAKLTGEFVGDTVRAGKWGRLAADLRRHTDARSD